jgi:hypothetical protein
MQLLGTSFVITLGSYQLRIGVSLENHAERGTCVPDDAPVFVSSYRNGSGRVETAP